MFNLFGLFKKQSSSVMGERSKVSKKEMPLPSEIKLTKSEKKALNQALQRSQPNPDELSAQDSLPFLSMMQDGMCRLTATTFSRTVQFFDINYQLSTSEDQDIMFEAWCEFISYFPSDIHFEQSFLNLPIDLESYADIIFIKPKGDADDPIRVEYTNMLQNQMAKGNNGLVKTKYLTFTIEAEDMKAAKSRLERIEADVRSNFKRLGVACFRLDGKDRLGVLRNALQVQSSPFNFDWRWMVPSGLCEKDFIVPSSFEFGDARGFRTGDTYGCVSCLQIMANDLKDKVLSDFLNLDSPQIISIHVTPIDHAKALKMVKAMITDLEKSKIDEQKKAVRAGYDMDILPPELQRRLEETKALLEDLQSHNERLLYFTFLIVNTGSSLKKLKNNIGSAQGVAQQHSCNLIRLDYQQEQSFMSAMPLGLHQVSLQRTMTITSTAVFVPFTTHELFQRDGEPLYCGINALSNNLIMVDRKKLRNPNGLILGTPGSGKSFAAKREIYNVYLVTQDDIIICDPESEYTALTERLHGQVVRISANSEDYINPLDLYLASGDLDELLTLKSDFVLSLFELILTGREGLQPEESSILDRCIRNDVYTKYLADPKPENMPILRDLYEALARQPEEQAKRLHAVLEIYVDGSQNVFNHRTNVNLKNRIICYDVKELGNSLKKIGMMVVQDQVWSRVSANRAQKKSTRYFMDEFHLLLVDKQTASYSATIWKRFRKWGGIPTGLTQNVKDLLNSPEIASIFDNTDYIYLLNQGSDDRKILARQLRNL